MTLPDSLAANPRLGDWLRVRADGRVDVRSGKVELGQGVLTALAQVVAEELDVDVARVGMLPAATGAAPDEGYTAGSLSVQRSGAALRQAAAEARELLVGAAASALGVQAAGLRVEDGTIVAPDGRSTTYWALECDRLLDRPASGRAVPKPVEAYSVVGTSTPRLDLPDKLAPRPRFVQDLTPDPPRPGTRPDGPGRSAGPAAAGAEGPERSGAAAREPRVLYGRVVRPPSRGAVLAGVDAEAVRELDDVVAVVRDGSFLGVVAEREEVALRAADRLRADATWREHATLPDEDDLPAFLTSAPAETTVLAESGQEPEAAGPPPGDAPRRTSSPGGPGRAPGPVARSYEGVFHRPYLAHASMGPSAATARVGADGGLEVWTHSQGPYVLRRELARVLGVAAERVTVRHAEGAGCYGHNGADDVALDAALLARAVPGRAVRVVWSRADELGWAPFGPAAVVRVAADVDARGDVLAWRHEIWGNGHSTRPGSLETPSLLAAGHVEDGDEIAPAVDPPLERGGGAGRNAVPGYAFPAYRVVNHRLAVMPLRTSALRALGATVNVFAIESAMDELARAAGRDPVAYRLDHLRDPRARAVLTAAALRSGWADRSPAESVGHGVAYARYKNTGAYCAVVAEVEATTEVRVCRLTIAVDAGLIVNPDGAENQIEGGAIQATSWALKERVRFDDRRVTSDTWDSYPILRFSEVPEVDVELLPAAGNPAAGVGEAAQGPTIAAIANALHDALDIRVRTLPLTPGQLGPGPREEIEAALDRLGIERRLRTTVAEAGDGYAVLSDGTRVEADAVVWSVGMRASELTRQISGELDHLGRVPVDKRLRALPEVFAAGDTAAAFDAEHTVMQSCQHATPLGKVAGYNAAADLLGKPLRDFTPGPYVTCLDLGGAGAIFTRGWDRRVMASGADGADGADVKRPINQHIQPPVDDAGKILAAADRVYAELPFFPRDEEKSAPAA